MTAEQVKVKIEEVLNRLTALGLKWHSSGLHFNFVDENGLDVGFGFDNDRQMLEFLNGVHCGILFCPRQVKDEN